MQISATSSTGPLAWSPPRPAATPGTAMSAQQAPHSAAALPADSTAMLPPAPIPKLTPSDRAAVAGATGVYLSPDGQVTPAATAPSWTSINRYVKQRHRQADAAAVAAAYNIPVGDGVARIDVHA